MLPLIDTGILITVALKAEATPLIRHFDLKPQRGPMGAEVYGNDEIFVTVTGVGKVRAAAATAAFLAVNGRKRPFVAVNAGIAAAARETGCAVGDVYLVNKITDAATGRDDYPDMTVGTALPESPLTTVDAPVGPDGADLYPVGLADMEGTGFYQAAAMFLSPHRIAAIKVVSDLFEPGRMTASRVRELIAEAVPVVEETAFAYRNAAAPKLSGADIREGDWMREVSSLLRLTVSQQHQLADRILVYFARGAAELPNLAPYREAPPTSKQERNRRFEALRKQLEL